MTEHPIVVSGDEITRLRSATTTELRLPVDPKFSQRQWLTYETLQRSPRAKPCIIRAEQWAQFAHPLAGQTVNGLKHDEWSPLTCIKSPYGKPGDHLWVREAWRTLAAFNHKRSNELAPSVSVRYESGDDTSCYPYGKLRPAALMPRWASRLTLVVSEVRVEPFIANLATSPQNPWCWVYDVFPEE